MMIFLILAPYGAFAFLLLVTSAAVTLFASAAICAAVIAIDVFLGRSIKILAAGSIVVFAAIGAYVVLIDPALNASGVRFAVDTGIFVISLASILVGYPFTLQYAGEVSDAETAKLPGFIRANYIITWAWTAASLMMMVGNFAMIYIPGLPFWGGLLIAFAARNSAMYFTKWYPQYCRAKDGTPAAGAMPGTH